ncbi:unnamed protein product, partial [Prorocentrum cordatum]
ASESGIEILVSRTIVEGAPISSLRFLDGDTDASALVLTAADLCMGWDPLEDPANLRGAGAPEPELSFFFRVRVARGAITAADMGLGPGAWCPAELLLLGTDEGVLEVHELRLSDPEQRPELRSVIDVGQCVVATALGDHGRIAFAAATTAEGDDLSLYGYDSSDGRCTCSMQPGITGLVPAGLPARDQMSLAHNDHE